MRSAQVAKYRVQIDFFDEAFNELNELVAKTHASSRAEIIRNAIGTLQWVVKHLLEGNKIVVKRKDGTETEIEFPYLLI